MKVIRNFITIILIFAFAAPSFSQPKSTVKHPSWSYDKVIYEVNVRQYTQEGTFKAFEKHLPRLKEMGVGVLWLMPINPIGEKNRKGTLGSYYSIKDYLGVNPEFGTLEDFKDLVKKVHENGMYIIIDWVANHTSWDNPLINEHPEWYTKDSLGNFVAPVADWQDVVDLNYDNKELWKYMTDALKYWVKECGIDGYRCDVAGMVPTAFWDQARAELDKIKPVFMLAEWETPEMHLKAFDMTYSWDMYKTANEIAKGKMTVKDIYKQFEEKESTFPKNAFRMRFTTNHDENTWNGTEFERLGEGAETFTAFNFVIPGMPLIYTGQESALDKRLEFFEKDPVNWKDYKLQSFFTKLISLKKNNKALHNGEKGGEFIPVKTNQEEKVIAFVRKGNGNKVAAIFNLSDSEVEVELSHKELTGNYVNYLTGEKVNIAKDKETRKLKAWEYIILTKK